jgi:2-pyrone-4,6-dicarboxylate lactonase
MSAEPTTANRSPPQSRSPSWSLPEGSCDTHCHIWGPFDRYPMAQSAPYSPPERDIEVLTNLHRRLGLTRTVLVQAIVYRTDNRIILDAIAANPEQRRGIALIEPEIGEAELAQLHHGGIRGVRFGFVKHLGSRPDMAAFHRTIERITPYGWHVVLHLDAGDLLELKPTLDKLELPFVVDHMGRVDAGGGLDQPAFRQLLELAKRDNCWIKLSGADRVSAIGGKFDDVVPFASALLAASPDRTLWGTDYPHPNPRQAVEDDADLVDLLQQVGPPAALHKLLVDNPARLYGFKDSSMTERSNP